MQQRAQGEAVKLPRISRSVGRNPLPRSRRPSASGSPAVWILNHYADNRLDGHGLFRHALLGSNLASRGWDVSIISASTSHRTRRQRNPNCLSTEKVDGVRWLYAPTPSYVKSGLKRLVNIVVFTVQVLRPGVLRGLPAPAVIVGSAQHLLTGWAALRLSKRWGVPFVFEVRDLWPETLIELGAISRNGLPARAMRALEGHLYRHADHVISTMPHASEYIADHGVGREKVSWISNGVDYEEFPATPKLRSETFRFLYFGAMGRANDLDVILDGFAALKSQHPDLQVELIFIGDGPLKEDLRCRASRLGVSTAVNFRDAVPRSEIPREAARADAMVISLLHHAHRSGVSPNKLYEYLASGRPTLFIGSPLNNPVRESDAGVVCETGEPESVARAMKEILDASEDRRLEWGRNGRDHAESTYSIEALGEKLAHLLSDVIRDRTKTRAD